MYLPKKKGKEGCEADHLRESDCGTNRVDHLCKWYFGSWASLLDHDPSNASALIHVILRTDQVMILMKSWIINKWPTWKFTFLFFWDKKHGSLLSLMTAKYRWLNVCYWRPSCLVYYIEEPLFLSLLSPLTILCWLGDHGKGVENHSTTSPLYSCIYLSCNT